jgi:hypothetical protein
MSFCLGAKGNREKRMSQEGPKFRYFQSAETGARSACLKTFPIYEKESRDMKKYLLMAVVLAAILFTGVANAEMVAHWTFDEGFGNIAHDSTTNANNGTIYNGSWASGVLNGALQFNGSSSYAVVPNSSSLNITGSITVSTWIKMDSVPTNYVGVVAKGGGDPSYNLEFNVGGARVALGLQDG